MVARYLDNVIFFNYIRERYQGMDLPFVHLNNALVKSSELRVEGISHCSLRKFLPVRLLTL